MTDKLLSYIGLAKRAGKLISGSGGVEDAVRRGSASVVVLAEDASAGTAKRIADKCSFYRVTMLTYRTKEALGNAIGAGEAACVAVTDPGLAKVIVQWFQENNGGGNIW